VFILGLGLLGVGGWLVVTEHTRSGVCNSSGGSISAVPAACQGVGSMYLVGFVLIGFGLIVLFFTSLMKRHEFRYRSSPRATEMSIRSAVVPSGHSESTGEPRQRGMFGAASGPAPPTPTS